MNPAAVIALGGIVALDATSFGQLMLSRPLIAGALAGVVVGMPMEGALVGALLEALSLAILPVGASRYPETGTGAVAAVGTLGLSGAAPTAAAILLTLVWGLLWQHAAAATVVYGRHLNERMMRAGETRPERMDELIELRHVASMGLDVLRGVLVTGAALLTGVPLLRLAVPHWGMPSFVAAVAVATAAVAVLASAIRLFGEGRRDVLLVAVGVLGGSLLLLLMMR